MEILEHLNTYPLPKLALSETKISLRGTGIIYGQFEIFNDAEGELYGEILPMADFISFSPVSFVSNAVTVEYTIDLTSINGEVQTGALIKTNGGERVLDFLITANRPDVLERDGFVMAEIADFADYARTHPMEARKLFLRQEFMEWLISLGYPGMQMYENFLNDPNKERAVDNFLVLNNCKQKASVMMADRDLYHKIGMWEDVITGSIKLKKSTWGYAEGALQVTAGNEWLKLTKDKVESRDFDGQNMAQVHYMILAPEVKGRDTAQVVLNDDEKINIRVSPAQAFEAKLDKQSFFFEDTGKLAITNNTGRDIFIEINCDNFIRFDAKRYLINKYAQIDFSVKYTNFRASTLSFKKQTHAQSYIQITAVGEGQAGFSKRIPITLWAN